jgi:hypothetical protein
MLDFIGAPLPCMVVNLPGKVLTYFDSLANSAPTLKHIFATFQQAAMNVLANIGSKAAVPAHFRNDGPVKTV